MLKKVDFHQPKQLEFRKEKNLPTNNRIWIEFILIQLNILEARFNLIFSLLVANFTLKSIIRKFNISRSTKKRIPREN